MALKPQPSFFARGPQSTLDPNVQGFGFSDPNRGNVFGQSSNSGSLRGFVDTLIQQSINQNQQGSGQTFGQTNQQPVQQQQQQQQPPTEQRPSEPDIGALESLIQPALDTLSGLEEETRSLLGGGEQQAEAFRTAGVQRAEQSREEGTQAVERQRRKTKTRGKEAETQQRRGFSEIARNILGRFGRSGFGQGITGAVSESTLQNIGRIRSGLQETMQQLFEQQRTIERELDTAIEETNFQAEQLKNQARSQLQQALSDIASRRTELQSRRAELVNNALQQFRQNVIDINSRNQSFQQQLFAQREAANRRIQEAQGRAANVAENLASFDLAPGTTRVIPVTQLGGEEGAERIARTELPGNLQFSQAGPFGVFNAPDQNQTQPSLTTQDLLRQAAGGGQ